VGRKSKKKKRYRIKYRRRKDITFSVRAGTLRKILKTCADTLLTKAESFPIGKKRAYEGALPAQ